MLGSHVSDSVEQLRNDCAYLWRKERILHALPENYIFLKSEAASFGLVNEYRAAPESANADC
jgi:hypothetical protein